MKIAQLMAYIVRFIHVQLFITLISLPILIAWGMPISLLTFAGNLLLSPVLTVFLLLASLIFFCHMLFIPCGILIKLLEQVTSWWLHAMMVGNNSWLIALKLPSCIFLVFIFIGTLGI